MKKDTIMKNKSKIFLFEIILYLNILLIPSLFLFLILKGSNANIIGFIIAWCIWTVAFIIISIALLMDTITLVKNKDKSVLIRQMKKIKYSSITYFILNFIILGVVMIGVVMGSRGMGIILLPIPFILTYFILVATSFYGIGLLLLLYREGKITIKKFILFIILHLTFVLDIISTMLIMKICRDNSLSEGNQIIKEI